MKRIFFDTVATGLNDDDEIVELAITDERDNTLYSQRFKPEKSMSAGASRVTGITDDMLVDMPTFADEFDKIKSVFAQVDQAHAAKILAAKQEREEARIQRAIEEGIKERLAELEQHQPKD